jgi:transglutaminase-like putative cysteine protease
MVDHYLVATDFIDWDHQDVRKKAIDVTDGSASDIEKARKLFYFVRDSIRYNPYSLRTRPDHFRASFTLSTGEGFCVQKAILLAALGRAVGIKARLGFAILKNHLLPDKLASILVGNEIPDHGYTEFFLGGKWVKATPAFDIEMCEKNRFIPVEFDGEADALFGSHTKDGLIHIEYVSYRGSYQDFPFEEMLTWLAPALTTEGKSILLQCN